MHLALGTDLFDSFERYHSRLIDEYRRLSSEFGFVSVDARLPIEELQGDSQLERVRWRDGRTGATDIREIRHLFLMTGANPNTAWLQGCLALDAKQFIKTGADLGADWPLRRAPYLLESSLPGVFAVGDVRAESLKRVASAVGEGSMAVQFVHKVLAE